MKGEPLPDCDHVARYCARKYSSEIESVTPGAFMLRKDESYLSVQWLEYLKKDERQKEIAEVRKIFGKHLIIKPRDKIAVLNVAKTCDHVARESGYNLRFLHQPGVDSDAHSGIFGTAQDEELIAELIKEIIEELHSAL